MDDEIRLQMTIPLDSDGFLRRECPTCEREFKWLSRDDEEDATEEEVDSYTCPYCGVEAPPGDWFTQGQLAQATAIVEREIIAPELARLDQSLRRIGGQSGGLVSASLHYDQPEEPVQETTESDDMRRVTFGCHPEMPVKVLDDWASIVYCVVCGQESAP